MLRPTRILRPRVPSPLHALVVLGVVWLLLGASHANGTTSVARETPLDPTEGSILGSTAVAFMATEPGEPGAILDYSRFEAHLVGDGGSADEELVFPSGEWFLPPPGKYKVWMEGAERMSRHPVILNYSGGTFQGRGILTAMDVGPAGTVALAEDVETGPTTALRLLYVNHYQPGEPVRNELSRRVSAEQARTGVLMPEGEVVAALFDNASRRYLALSPPTEVAAGARIEVRPTPPESGSHVLVSLEGHDLEDLEIWLETATSKLVPAVVNRTAHRLYAIWYEAPPGAARVRVSSPRVYLEPIELNLEKGSIERVSGELRPLPDLEVELDLPKGFPTEGLALKVLTRGRTAEVTTASVEPDQRLLELADLPAAELETILETAAGSFWKRVDLRDGLDQRVVFRPEALPVAGTVYWGEDPHPAALSFGPGGAMEPDVMTDSEGNYETVLFQPLASVAVWLEGFEGAPYRKRVSKRSHEVATLDIRVPKTFYEVHVVDAETGDGISGASVSSLNETAVGGQSQVLMADAAGIAKLQPLEVGKARVMARSDGYLAMTEPLEFEIGEGDTDGAFEIALVPEGPTSALRLLLADGRSPAAGCELLVVASLANRAPPVWSGACDAQGLAKIPRDVEGLTTLVRHPAAGFLIRALRASDLEEGSAWTLPARASSPLALRVSDGLGAPIPYAGLAVWIDEVRIEGGYLAWLAGSRQPVTDAAGFWVGDNFPARSFEVAAWGIHAREEARTGNLEAQATLVSYPWSGEVSIRGLN